MNANRSVIFYRDNLKLIDLLATKISASSACSVTVALLAPIERDRDQLRRPLVPAL